MDVLQLMLYWFFVPARKLVGGSGSGEQHFETKDNRKVRVESINHQQFPIPKRNCVFCWSQVLEWTADFARIANVVQLEMDPHQRTTNDYDEHHKQRQAQSALEMALENDDSDEEYNHHR